MKVSCKSLRTVLFFASVLSLLPSSTFSQHYKQTNLVSDIMGMAPTFDPNLQNPWGLSRSSGSPWWVADNNSGKTTLYDGSGNIIPINGTGFVTIPPPKGSSAAATPTGTVFNVFGASGDFVLPNGTPAFFLFSTEDGTISGWNGGPNAVLVVDNSDSGSADGAVYKALTSADVNGKRFLYVTNFRSAKVEVYDTHFRRVRLDEDAFDDEEIPHGFAPFNVQNIGGTLLVTYAKQDGPRHDPVGAAGLGFVDIYTPTGKLVSRLQHGSWMNAPWGVVWTPRDFGEYSNSILVGNFRSGQIAAFNGFTGKFIGLVKNPDNTNLTIDGLWALAFGNNGAAGSSTTLFFSAGIQNELHGLFGTITPVDGLDGDEE